DALLHQRFLEGVGAAEHESDEIVAPMRRDVSRLLHHLAVAPDAIARHVGADVEIRPERWNAEIADIGNADNRARLWIELAEAMKGGSVFFRQDREIALHKAIGDAGGGRGHAPPAIAKRLQRRPYPGPPPPGPSALP